MSKYPQEYTEDRPERTHGAIPKMTDRLQAGLDELGSVLNALYEALEPDLRPARPEPDGEAAGIDGPERSEHARQLERLGNTTQGMVYRARHILDRLDL